MKTKLIGATIVLVLLAYATDAARMFPLSIQQLTDKAHLVLHGSVTKKAVQRDAEGRIYTRVDLEVVEAWKGGPETKSFVVVQSGGVLGEETAAVDGQEELTLGEEVVLFLVLNQRGEGVVIGLSQGKFKVTKDAVGEKTVHNIFHGTAPGQTRSATAGGKDRSSALSLVELKARVQGGRP